MRSHFRRCDGWKGYENKRVTVEDAWGVLNTLSLKSVRKPALIAMINQFKIKPGEVGDKDFCIKCTPPSPIAHRTKDLATYTGCTRTHIATTACPNCPPPLMVFGSMLWWSRVPKWAEARRWASIHI